MSKESGDATTPVRRSGRARKPNSRFADDEVEGCFKKIVTGIGLTETTAVPTTVIGRSRKTVKKRDSQSEDKDERRSEEEDGTEKCLKSKPEFRSDESQRGLKGSRASFEAVSSSERDAKYAASNVLVNGLDDEAEKRYVGKFKTEGEETVEVGRKSRYFGREEMECSPKDVKKRGGKRRGKGKKIEEEEESEGTKSTDKDTGSLNGDSEDKDKNSNLEADELIIVQRSVADQKARKKTDTELYRMHRDESESTTSSVSDTKLGKPSSFDFRMVESLDKCENLRNENASVESEDVTGTEPADNTKLEIIETDEVADKTQATMRNIKEDQPSKFYICEKTGYLINGDNSSESVPGIISSDISSDTSTGSLKCGKRGILELEGDTYNEKSFRDKAESVPFVQTYLDLKESSDTYSSSNSGNEARGKGRGGKIARGRRKLIQSDSTDSTDSETSSPVRRRGRSGHHMLSKGLGDDGKERSTQTKEKQPHAKASSQPINLAESPLKVQTLTAKATHCPTKPEQSPSRVASTVSPKATTPLKPITPSKMVQSPSKSPLPSKAESPSTRFSAVRSKLIQSTKASLPAKTPASATESSSKTSEEAAKTVQSSFKVLSPAKAVKSPAEVHSLPDKGAESPTKTAHPSARFVESPSKAAAQSSRVLEDPIKSLSLQTRVSESPVKALLVSAKTVVSPTRSPSQPARAIESPYEAPSLPVQDKVFESPTKTPSLQSPTRYLEPLMKVVDLPATAVESLAKAPLLPTEAVEFLTKASGVSFKAPESPVKASCDQHSAASAPTQTVRPVESPVKALIIPTMISAPAAKHAQSAVMSPSAHPRAEKSPSKESLLKSPTRVTQLSTEATSPLHKSEQSPTKAIQLSPESCVMSPPMPSPSAKAVASLSMTSSPTMKVFEPQKKKDDFKEHSDACTESQMYLPQFSFDSIPLPPETQQTVSPESKLVEPSKGKRERKSMEEHKRSDTVEARGSSPEGHRMPKTKKRREDEFCSEQDSLIPYYSEDDNKRKLPIEAKDKENRKRRKVEHASIDDSSPKDGSSKTDNIEQHASSGDALLAAHVSPQSNVICGTNFEDKSVNMNALEENYSEYSETRKKYDENVESISEPCPSEINLRLEEIPVPQRSDIDKQGESELRQEGTTQESMISSCILKENIDHSGPEATGAFMHVSLPLDGSSIPFISDNSDVSGSCEIPGLSILSSETTGSELSQRYKNPKDDVSSVSGDARGLFASTAVQKGCVRKDEIVDLMDEENCYISNQIIAERESEAGVGGSRVEDIHMVDDLKREDTTVKLKAESEEIRDVKVEEHAFGSMVEEIKLTEEEIKERERKQQMELEERNRKNMEVVEQRLKSFTHLEENVYLGERKKTKRSKEVRRMLCDCSLSKEEIARGDVGCGDDCLNRLLMIECGSRCPLKDRCTNKRFQGKEYGDVEVFNADEKGCGLRARSSMPPGTFIMEYVGEVFDTREFKRRRKEYARDHTAHFYFMALKSDLLIDATRMGNISRFINHSCDPNAETQKWTVNGEVRIGFFSKKQIDAGDEINFDYRLERYGREPQKCYCGTPVCRGWLGESPDEKTKEEKDEERRKEERDKRKREERRALFEDIDLEDEIEKLNSHKLRNRQDTLNLCRLLVRVEDFSGRLRLLDLLQTGEAACRRLFLDYHGLKVLWSLMADLSTSLEHTTLKIEILKTLECLPITNKTQLTDSRVLALVERWSTQKADSTTISASGATVIKLSSPLPPSTTELSMLPPSTVSSDSDTNKKSSDTSEESDSELDIKTTNVIEASSADDSSLDSEVDQPAVSQKQGLEEESSDSSQSDSKENPTAPNKEIVKEEDEETTGVTEISDKEKEAQELLKLHNSMVDLALKLLDAWKNLKEFFRIPKKERIEMMKEHEREVDRGYKEYLDREEDSDRDWEGNRREKEQGRYIRRDSYYDRRRRSPDRDRHGRIRTSWDDRSSDSPKMSKEKRRQLFELKVQQEEEEAKQRKMQEEMWAMHVDRCRLLGHDPYLTPIFDPTYQYYWDPGAANWQPYTGSGQSHGYTPQYNLNIPVPAGYGQHKNDGEGGSPLTVLISGQAQGGQAHVGLLPHATDAQVALDDPLNPANIPLPGEIPALSQASPSQPLPGQAVPVEGTPPQGAKVLSIPLPGELSGATLMEPGATTIEGEEEPPPPPPGPITIQLPPRWKIARDAQGHVYFYHVKTRASQWEPPSLDQHNQIQAEMGSDSDSDSSSSDSDSTSTSDSEDFSSEEEEEEVVETVTRSEVSDEKMIRRVRGKKRRSEALVQERVISPIMEIDREAARRERREAKERAREEARQERQERQEEQVARMEAAEAGETRTRQERHETTTTTSSSSGSSSSSSNSSNSSNNINTTPSVLGNSSSRSKREKVKSKERAASAIADNSDAARKIKDNFRSKMATYIVSVLNPYRKLDCKEGKITCTEDFKYLARKLTHFVMVKELKQLHSIEALECSDSVKHKTKDFVRKYMSKYGSVFKRDPNDTKEY